MTILHLLAKTFCSSRADTLTKARITPIKNTKKAFKENFRDHKWSGINTKGCQEPHLTKFISNGLGHERTDGIVDLE